LDKRMAALGLPCFFKSSLGLDLQDTTAGCARLLLWRSCVVVCRRSRCQNLPFPRIACMSLNGRTRTNRLFLDGNYAVRVPL